MWYFKGNLDTMRFQVFTAVTMKNAVFWDVAPCRSSVNRRFGWTYRLHLQPPAHAGSSLADFSTLKMKAIRSSETSVHTRCIRRHIPEDGILQPGYSFLVAHFTATSVARLQRVWWWDGRRTGTNSVEKPAVAQPLYKSPALRVYGAGLCLRHTTPSHTLLLFP
jgi:hypothetical protein